MSHGIKQLHSHSEIERDYRFPKDTVLIDKEYLYLFDGEPCKSFFHKKKEYYKVNIITFVKKGGVFKNLAE